MTSSAQRKHGQSSPNTSHVDENTTGRPPSSLKMAHFPGWTLAPLRLFLGITFIYAGIQKLTDPQFFRPSATGYIGKQIIAFAHGSPIHDALMNIAYPHAQIFGQLVAYGELAIGLGALLGLLFRPAALFGMLLSLLFFLSASFHVYPYFYGADIVFVFGWFTLLLVGPLYTGLPSIDGWLISTLAPDDHVQQPEIMLRLLFVLLGESWTPHYMKSAASTNNTGNSQSQPTFRDNIRKQSIAQRKKQARRSFLAGVFSGGIGALGLAAIGLFLRGRGADDSSDRPDTRPATTNPAPTSAAPANATPGSSNVIARTSDVAKNSAVTFTIPSSGDPGVLIHLPSNQFVAYDATCTHAGCQVDYDAGSQHIICPCHGATYDPAHAAAVLEGPANTPLASVQIHIDAATGTIVLQ